MTFVDFARGYGLIMDRPIVDGRWHRVPTTDKRASKRNGAYAYWGDRGICQNWATMCNAVVWRENGSEKHQSAQELIRSVAVDNRKRHREARKVAAGLLSECDRAKHPYLAKKGFPEALGFVHPSGDLLIPMRDHVDYDCVNSVQRINADGGKKFLHGGKAKGSVFRLGSKGQAWIVEGYATGLSVDAALHDLRQIAYVLVCFSSGNMVHVSKFVRRPAFVFADNDASGAGEKAARDTGLPFCMAPQGDANDLMLSNGLRAVCSLILDAQNSD